MMAAQSYPSGQPYPMNLSPNQPSPTMYRVGHHSQTSTPVGAAGMFAYPTPSPHGSSVYRSPLPDINTYGLITPPTNTPSQFGSPMIASGGYTPMSTPGHQWGTLNALALSPMGHMDPSMGYGYHPHAHHASPIMGQDPNCAAPGEVFSSVPLRTDLTGDALGFHHGPYGAHPHHPGVFRGTGLGLKAHGQFILGADGQPTTEIKKRSRTAQACERCRIRKARCFGGNPCNRCTKRRFVCEFSTAVRQRGPNKPPVNSSIVNGGPGNTSAPTTALNPPGSAGLASALPSSGANSPTDTAAQRRHSLPEQQSQQQYLPRPPNKGYSTTDVPRLACVGEEAPMTFTLPNGTTTTAVPHLPAPPADYLAVPQQPASAGGLRSHGDQHMYSTPGTTTPVSAPNSNGQHSPMFAYTPEMDSATSSALTTGSSIDYPYTPISPATTFSPNLAMTPTVNAHAQAVGYFTPQQDATNTSF